MQGKLGVVRACAECLFYVDFPCFVPSSNYIATATATATATVVQVCNCMLRTDTYSTINDEFYCTAHYDETYKKAGGYDFAKVEGPANPDTIAEEPSSAAEDTLSNNELKTEPTAPGSIQASPMPSFGIRAQMGALTGNKSGGLVPAVFSFQPGETKSFLSSTVDINDDDDLELESAEVANEGHTAETTKSSNGHASAVPSSPVMYRFNKRTQVHGHSNLRTNVMKRMSYIDNSSGSTDTDIGRVVNQRSSAAAIAEVVLEEETSTNPEAEDLKPIAAVFACLGEEISTETGTNHLDATAKLTLALETPDDDDNKFLNRKLGKSVRGGGLDECTAIAAAKFVDNEIRKLITVMSTVGTKNSDGQCAVLYRNLAEVAFDEFESLVGTLRTAKKTGVVKYNAPMLMRGVHDAVSIVLLKEEISDANMDTYTYKQIRLVSCKRVKAHKGALKGKSSAAKALGSELTLPSPMKLLHTSSVGPDADPCPTPTMIETKHSAASANSSTANPSASLRRRSIVELAEEDAVKDVLASLVSLSHAVLDSPPRDRRVTNEAAVSTSSEADSTADTGAAAVTSSEGQDGDEDEDEDEDDEEDDDDQKEGDGANSPEAVDPIDAAEAVPETSKLLNRTLGESCRRGQLPKNRALLAARWVDKELRKLIGLIVNNGAKDGKVWRIKFGDLFRVSQDVMEAVSGTLKTAKKHGIVAFDAEVLFQGVSDKIVITLLKEVIADGDEDTCT